MRMRSKPAASMVIAGGTRNAALGGDRSRWHMADGVAGNQAVRAPRSATRLIRKEERQARARSHDRAAFGPPPAATEMQDIALARIRQEVWGATLQPVAVVDPLATPLCPHHARQEAALQKRNCLGKVPDCGATASSPTLTGG